MKNFNEAVNLYSQAIELSQEKPNHVYFANRANAYLELFENQKCVEDCDMAIKIEPSFAKSYFRKAKANFNLQNLVEAMETLKIGIKYDENNESMNQLLKEIKAEIEEDNKIPPDHPERKRF